MFPVTFSPHLELHKCFIEVALKYSDKQLSAADIALLDVDRTEIYEYFF